MIDAGVCTNREQLLQKFDRGGVWAEVGVASGSFSKQILDNVHPTLLVLVDAWGLVNSEPQADDGYKALIGVAREDHRINVIRQLSDVAAGDFADATFDVVYIDADHTRAYQDATAWWLKVKSGGYLTGHDYIDPKRWESESFITVKRDIDRFAAECGLQLTVTNEQYGSWVIHKGS